MRAAKIFVLGAALLAFAACENRTYVVVTVDVDPALSGNVSQVRFDSRIKDGDTVVSTDSQSHPDSPGAALTFPTSFVIVADGHKTGETVEVFAEGSDGASNIRGRARGAATIVSGEETTLQITLTAPCASTEECLGGAAFCDAPATCDCGDGGDCAEGFCVAIPLDDGNPCTTADCNEAAQIVTQIPADDGTACGNATNGLPVSCVAGVCGCGDGSTNSEVEQCDEGASNADQPNRCRLTPACTLPFCGDGIVDDAAPFFEECDDGAENNVLAPDACRPNCKLPTCGDFIRDTGEECDSGIANSDTAPLACRMDCRVPSCGDGVTDTGLAFGLLYEEECDDGAGNSNTAPNACRQSITLENGTGATVECKCAFCGDDVVDTGGLCGDGIVVRNERCDDNNSANGDGCNPTCNLFGDVALLAGAAGGSGNADGVNTDARIRDVFGLAVSGGFGYFTSDESHASTGDNLIRRVDLATGQVTTLVGTRNEVGDTDGTGPAVQLRGARGIEAVGTDLYFVDALNHKLKKLDTTTNAVTTIAGSTRGNVDGDFATAQFAEPSFIAARTATELIVFDDSSSVGCRLRRVDLSASTVEFIAGSDFCTFAFDGSGSGAFFGEVSGIAMGPEPYLYVADTSRIRRVDLSVTPATVETIADSTDGLSTLGDLVAGPTNDLYIADRGNDVIQHFDIGTEVVTPVDIGTDTLSSPRAIGREGNNLVISELTEHTMRIGDISASPVTFAPLAGKAGQAGSADGPATDARFDVPVGLAVGTAAGTLDWVYVADQQNGAIRAIDLGGSGMPVSTLATTGSFALGVASAGGRLFGTFDISSDKFIIELDPTSGATTGIGSNQIVTPSIRGVTALGGFAYVVAPNAALIWRVDLSDGAAIEFAGTDGNQGVGDGDRTVAQFSFPYAAVACGDDIYITDSAEAFEAHTIRKLDLTAQTVSTLAGAPTVPGTEDGVGSAARFYSPEGIACDGESLYVADRFSGLIRQIELATGRVTTLAGTAFETGAVDGVGTDARFSAPRGLVYDPTTGDLFVTDSGENVVRRIQ